MIFLYGITIVSNVIDRDAKEESFKTKEKKKPTNPDYEQMH